MFPKVDNNIPEEKGCKSHTETHVHVISISNKYFRPGIFQCFGYNRPTPKDEIDADLEAIKIFLAICKHETTNYIKPIKNINYLKKP